jgi:hypothetical protein
MGEIPHSEKMFHLPIEVAVYVPSTQDVDKVVSKSEMKSRVDEVKKFLASLFGGFSSAPVEGGFLASDGKVVKEDVEKVVSFAPREDFEKNKEALVRQASEWASRWGQEAIGLEHEGDLYYVPQKFENGGTIAIREAKEMANSQALEIKHHASELANALKGNPTIEAWVIAKLERASNDLADVTHYLEGRVQMSGKKMANGGNLSENTIKVKVNYLEQQYFQLEKEMEIPFSDFKEYDKTGKISSDLQGQLESAISSEQWIEKSPVSITITPVANNKMASGGQTQAQRNKVAKVMGEFKDGTLYSSSGDKVTNRKQAIAIALSEAGLSKYEHGGNTEVNDPQFIEYKGEEIMFVPVFNSYYVNDVEFTTIDEAKSFIDKGAPMSDEIKEAYRKGLFAEGGNMKFERPTYKSSYVASQDQSDNVDISDENWNMDYENDPVYKAQQKAKENSKLAKRAGLAYLTKGASEMGGSGHGAEGGKPDIGASLKGMK